ncbi:MAG: hypothetical protein EBT95_02555 [Verrucomicrobia bacterium]|nr:hypothetical protein [Verrucomicrobiota bacterium]
MEKLKKPPSTFHLSLSTNLARKLEQPLGCSSPPTYPHAIWDAAPRCKQFALRAGFAPLTPPCALRFPLRVE